MFRCKGMLLFRKAQREIYFKELTHAMVGVLQVQNLQDGCQAKDLGKLQLDSKSHLLPQFLPAHGEICLCLFRPSIDWMRPTHSTESNLPSSESTDLRVNFIKTYDRNIHNNA